MYNSDLHELGLKYHGGGKKFLQEMVGFGNLTLDGYFYCYKLLYTYLFGYIFIYLQNLKFINTLKSLRGTIYVIVTQTSLAYKRLISTTVLSGHDVSHNNLRHHRGTFNVYGNEKRSVQPL